MAKQTIIRFADNELTLLRGSARGKGVQVDLCVREALPEGAMINGLVTDAGLLGEALEALRQKAGAGGKAKLVIDGGQLMMKALSAPKLTEKQLLNVTRSELEELGTAGRDMVYTYRRDAIFCAAAPSAACWNSTWRRPRAPAGR